MREVDYIVVGAGSAGCVLGGRLSEDSDVSVAVLEAGPGDRNFLISMPTGYFGLMKTGLVDWGYHTEPQAHCNDRVMWWPRGKVVGGSSSVNGMTYIRGNRIDFDLWAQMGNRGWSYDDVLPYFKKSENWVSGSSEFRGSSGPLKTARTAVFHPLTDAFLEAGREAGYRANDDFNGVEQEGFGILDATLAENRRQSSARAFLTPALGRKNLKVITRALAARVIVENGRAIGVEYLHRGSKKTLYCTREVILAGGAVNSPQLLQLSGIGNADHLRSVGVPVVHDLPGVGENLQDHVGISVMQRAIQPISLHVHTKPLRAAYALARYMMAGDGPAAMNCMEALAFVKTVSNVVEPDVQLHLQRLLYKDHGRVVVNEHGFMIYSNISRPDSRGWLRIKSADPRAHPAIQPNYFEAYNDLVTLRNSLKICRDIMSQPALAAFSGTEYAPGPGVRTDAEIEAYIRANVNSTYHPVGTCKMGTDTKAVVDNELRVHGISGLRVCDASIMPTVVSGNTNAASIMIGEKGADFVRGRSLATVH